MVDQVAGGHKQHRHKLRLSNPVVIDAVAGGTAGGITAIFVSPLEVLKTRLQTQQRGSPNAYRGGLHVVEGLKRIVQQEGVIGLYRGLGPQLAALLPNWAVYFSTYNYLKKHVARAETLPQPIVHMLSAVGAGAATSVVTNPLWMAKTRLQTQHMGSRPAGRPLYRGTADCIMTTARQEGIGALYSGMAASFLGLTHVAIQFPCYELGKKWLAERRQQQTGDPHLRPIDLVLASSLSKAIASACTYPHEVVRSRMHVAGQYQISAVKDVAVQIWRDQGLKGLYAGFTINLLRTVPAAAISFTSYELIASKLREIDSDNREAA